MNSFMESHNSSNVGRCQGNKIVYLIILNDCYGDINQIKLIIMCYIFEILVIKTKF